MALVIKNVNLVDVAQGRLLENRTLSVINDFIAKISKGDTGQKEEGDVVEGDGLYAMPGLIDLHTHLIWSGGADPVDTVEKEGAQVSLLRAASNAFTTLRHGITCVRDLGSNEDSTLYLAAAVERGYLPGPRIISCGCTIIMTGGHDPFWGIEADGETELVKAVRDQVRKGAKVIKISATGGVYGRLEGESVESVELTAEEIGVICREAHRFDLKVAAHAISEKGIWNCIEQGVDTIEHGHFMTRDAISAMKEKEITWVPTLYVYRQIAEGKDLPFYAVSKARKIVDIHRKAFEDGMKQGVDFGAGSDAGSPNTPHGALLDEIEAMVEYGCPPAKAIQAATVNGARALGLEKELGTLESGKKADILVLKKNPLENIANLREIYCVIKDGVVQC